MATADQRETAFEAFSTSLTNINTAPVILASINSHLRQLLALHPEPLMVYVNPPDPLDQAVLQTTIQQNNIGWRHFL
jgi:hypothetical protein